MRVLLFFLLFAGALTGKGQNPVSHSLTNQNGLPSNTVYHMLQDSKGYMWIGHDRGLSRYDGVKFTQFKASMLQGYSLSNLLQAETGEIWAQDFSGNFYFTRGDSVIREQAFVIPGAYSRAGIIQGHLLVSLKFDSIRVLNMRTKQRSSIAYPGSYNPGVYYDKQQLFFISGNILYRFDGKKMEVQQVFEKPLSTIFHLQKTSYGFVAFSKIGFPNAYVISQTDVRPLQLLQPNTFIQEVNVRNNEYWVCTTAGAYCFTEKMTPLFNGHCFFNNSSISRIVKDREGSYWFASLDKGLIFVPNIHTRLHAFNNESVTALGEKDEETLLAGTNVHRLLAFDTKANAFRMLYKEPTNHEVINILHDNASGKTFLCSDRITYLQNFSLKQHYMLAGKNVVPIGNNWYAFSFSNGVRFLNSIHPNDTLLPTPFSHLQKATRLTGRGRWVLYNSSSSLLLAATSVGLFYFLPTSNGSLSYNGAPIFASSLLQVGDEVFVTTYSQGVLVVDKSFNVRSLTEKSIAKSIYKMQVHNDDVWMLADEAVLKYNRRTQKMLVFSVADGLPKAEYKDMRWLNGQLYVATTQGLVTFNASMPASNAVAPLVGINQVLINGESVAWEAPLELASNQNNLSIGFSVLAYKNTNEQSVTYKINNQPWEQLAYGVRTLYLSALAPGKYTLQIQATNEDGLPAAEPLRLTFFIQAPLYRQWWFLALLSALAIAAVYVYFHVKLARKQKENALITQKIQLEKELERSKLVSIKSQMNPHFFFNALNTIQSYIYSNDKLEASNYLNQFSELTRMVLDMSNKDLISLSDELKALKLYLDLEALRFEDKLAYTLSVANNIQPELHWLPPMLIQPYVENAIKHGLLHSKIKWELTVAFSLADDGLVVVIDDNGVGRKKSAQLNAHRYRQHESFAMSANEKRLEILNKGLTNVISIQITDKYDALGMATGTTVKLHVPTPPRHQ